MNAREKHLWDVWRARRKVARVLFALLAVFSLILAAGLTMEGAWPGVVVGIPPLLWMLFIVRDADRRAEEARQELLAAYHDPARLLGICPEDP